MTQKLTGGVHFVPSEDQCAGWASAGNTVGHYGTKTLVTLALGSVPVVGAYRIYSNGYAAASAIVKWGAVVGIGAGAVGVGVPAVREALQENVPNMIPSRETLKETGGLIVDGLGFLYEKSAEIGGGLMEGAARRACEHYKGIDPEPPPPTPSRSTKHHRDSCGW